MSDNLVQLQYVSEEGTLLLGMESGKIMIRNIVKYLNYEDDVDRLADMLQDVASDDDDEERKSDSDDVLEGKDIHESFLEI